MSTSAAAKVRLSASDPRHVAHARRAEIVGRRQDGHHRARARVTAGALPRDVIECANAKEAQQTQERGAIVRERLDDAAAARRACHQVLGEGHGDREAFIGAERLRRAERDIARPLLDDRRVVAVEPCRSGVDGAILEARRLGQARCGPTLSSIGKAQLFPVAFQ